MPRQHLKTASPTAEHRELMRTKAKLLKALAHPVRLCILQTLVERDEQNVSEMHACMDVSQSTISQHLAKLRDLGLVHASRHGNQIHYQCDNAEVIALIKLLFERK